MTQTEENTTFFDMYNKYGPIKLAKMIAKLPSYKKYMQRYPFEGAEQPYSLDYIIPSEDGSEGSIALVDMLADVHSDVSEGYLSRDYTTSFKQTLTMRQLAVLELLEMGFKPRDIYKRLGYKSTGGVRYIKWAIRKKYLKFKELNSENED